MSNVKKECKEAIDKFYSKDVLFMLYKKYFLSWIADAYVGSNLDLFEISMICENTNKQTFLDILHQVYLDGAVFKNVYQTFTSELKDIFNEIVWEGKFYIDAEDKNKYYDVSQSFEKILKDEYLFFKLDKDDKNNEYLYIDNAISRQLKQYLKKPKNYFIYNDSKPKFKKSDNNEIEFLDNLSSYFDFYNQDGIVLSNSGKILKDSKVNMKKYCNIKEYYSNSKDLDFLKTETIALFFYLIDEKYKNSEYLNANNIKAIVNDFLSGAIVKKGKYTYSSLFLNYLKGVKNIWKHEEQIEKSFASIKEVLNEIMPGTIVSVQNITDSLIYRDKFIDIIDMQDVKDYIYINEANYERTKIVNIDKYRLFIQKPFVKSFLFILGILGVLELYYDIPSDDPYLYLKSGYLNKYDGLKYIKLTDLGAYIFNKSDNYEFIEKKQEVKIILDNERLLVTLLGEAPAKMMFLERVGHKISNNKYKISKESFLRGIDSSSSLKERVDEFYEKIEANPVGVWEEFFEDLLKKSTAIKAESSCIVLKLSNDKELISTIAKDKRFNDFILRGEDYHIIVKNEDINSILKLFKEYGYCINI